MSDDQAPPNDNDRQFHQLTEEEQEAFWARYEAEVIVPHMEKLAADPVHRLSNRYADAMDMLDNCEALRAFIVEMNPDYNAHRIYFTMIMCAAIHRCKIPSRYFAKQSGLHADLFLKYASGEKMAGGIGVFGKEVSGRYLFVQIVLEALDSKIRRLRPRYEKLRGELEEHHGLKLPEGIDATNVALLNPRRK